MSYCHLRAVGINVSEGFGDTIAPVMRDFIANSTCLGTCDVCNNKYYRDADGDGYGDANDMVIDCEAPVGYVDNMDDCNDNDASVWASDVYYQDNDSDTYGNIDVV